MPTKRILLTLKDVKELIAKNYLDYSSIDVFNHRNLLIEFEDDSVDIVDSETYLFQIDCEGSL